MKKLLVVALCVLLTLNTCFAESPDYTQMSVEELSAEYGKIRNELYKRGLVADEGETNIFDKDGVTVYLTGKYELHEFSNEMYIDMEAVVINNRETSIYFDPSASINGWDVNRYRGITVSAGHKCRDILEYNLSDAGISSYEEIEEIEFRLHIVDDSFKEIGKYDPVTIYFNKPNE